MSERQSDRNTRANLAVIGLGKVGTVIAAVYAAAGHSVIGVDIDYSIVESLQRGRCPHNEPGLQELIELSRRNLRTTHRLEDAIENSDTSIVIVPTPSERDGSFSNKFVNAAMSEVSEHLRNRDDYLLILSSTVSPGSCDGDIRQAIELASGKVVGKDVGLVYSPEFIALGSVIRDIRNPDLVLIGSSDTGSGVRARRLISTVVESSPTYAEMSLVSSEITKLAVNTYVTTKISFANMIGELCSKTKDASTSDVLRAIGADRRIGNRYLTAALGYGGPCFPRDNKAIQAMARRLNTTAPIAAATDEVNRRQVDLALDQITGRAPVGGKILVLGLSYKPFTSVCDESQGILIANRLSELGYEVLAHDPEASVNAARLLNKSVAMCVKLEPVIGCVDAIVISTPWPQYSELIPNISADTWIYDPWGVGKSNRSLGNSGSN